MREATIGAFVFGLIDNGDGTYTSKCLRPAEPIKEKVADEVRHFTAPSHSDPTVDYDVDVYPDGLIHCNCVGWGFRHNCSHCDDVRDVLDGKEVYGVKEK